MHVKVNGTFLWSLESNLNGSIAPVPHSRSKHAACLYDGHAYIYGGKNGNVPLKDLWRYNLRSGSWECLRLTGDIPPNLQEHTMVPYQNKLYIFGGNFQFGADPEIPFWVFDVGGRVVCRKLDGVTPFPEGRRGHTAVIYKDAMYIFAGYIDMRRSSSELWAYNFNSGSWRLLKAADGSGPSGRHSHSAVVHGHFMWIYGGLADLQTMNDLWCWDFCVERWTRVKATQGPPSLEGHSACVLHDLLLIYGGSHDGILQNDLWAYDVVLNVWTKISCKGAQPTPCTKHATVLAVHNDWCSRPPCVDFASRLQRTSSCPISSRSAVQLETRQLSRSARLAREAANPKSNLRNVEVDVLNGSPVGSHEKMLLSVNENNAGTVPTSVSYPPSDDIFFRRSGEMDAVPLLDDAYSSFSPLHGVTNPVTAELIGSQVSIDNFVDSSFDPVFSTAGSERVNNTNASFCRPNCTSEVSDKTIAENGSSDEGPKKLQHVLAVSLLGTPTKSLKCSADKPSSRIGSQSLVQHEKSSWVEMEMFGSQDPGEGSLLQEMLVVQDIEDGDIEPKENPSFNEHFRSTLEVRLSEGSSAVGRREEPCTYDSTLDSNLSSDSGQCCLGDSQRVKEAWIEKMSTNGVSKNGVEIDLTKKKLQSDSNQCSSLLDKHPVDQTELLKPKDDKLKLLPPPCPEYCMFVFGGRSSFGTPNLDIRSISVSRLEIMFGDGKK